MLTVVIPTYNEKENAAAMAAAVTAVLPPDGRILFVDDNSPDGTGAILDGLAAADARIGVLHRAAKEGLGRAYVAGFTRALAEGADYVVEMDCDFSHDPKDVARLYAACRAAGGAAVAVGSRYVPGGSTPGWPFKRRLVSRLGGLVTRVVTGLPVRDPTGGFKCFTRAALEKLGDFACVKSFGYSFQLEMNFRMWKAGVKIVEVPICFTERRAGYSKITGGIAVESLKMVFRLRFGR